MTKHQSFIEVDNATVRLGEHEALSNVSFELAEGEFLAIMGPNGAGKTTLIKALLGLLPLCNGSIRVGGELAEKYDPRFKGYVPQIKTLDRTFPATAIELVMSGMKKTWPWRIGGEDRTAALSALMSVRAEGLAERPVSRLSGGELQRVYLARAFVRRPKLILLDEPATGIDSSGETDLFFFLDEYKKDRGATVVMITHDWETTFHHATKLLLLNRRAIGFGDPDSASRDADLRAAFGHVGHAHDMHVGKHDHHHHDHGHSHD